MASSRETLVFLITEKTDMDIAQANAYISNITANIEENSLEDFIKGMVRAVGRSDIDKIDAVSLDNMVQSITASTTIHTKQQVEAKKEQREEKRIDDSEQLKQTFNRIYENDNKENKALKDMSDEEVYADYKNSMDTIKKYIPKELLMPDTSKIEKLVNEYKEEHPDWSETSTYHIAETQEEIERTKEIEAELVSRGIPINEAKKYCSRYKADRLLSKYYFKDRPTTKDFVEVCKIVDRIDEKHKDKVPQTPEDEIKLELQKKLELVNGLIKMWESQLEDDPTNVIIHSRLRRSRIDKTELQDSILDLGHDVEKDKYLDKDKTIKSTYQRRSEINKKIDELKAQKASKIAERDKENDPIKRNKIEKELISIQGEINVYRGKLMFETVHGRTLDGVLESALEEGPLSPQEAKHLTSQYKLMRIESEKNGISYYLGQYRSALENPDITKEQRIDILKEIQRYENEEISTGLSVLGLPRQASSNLLQRLGSLTTKEYYELKKYELENALKDRSNINKFAIKELERKYKNAQKFGNTIAELQEKGYTKREICLLLDAINKTRENRNVREIAQNDRSSIEDYLKKAFAGIAPKDSRRVVVTDFIESFMKDGDERALKQVVLYKDTMVYKKIAEERVRVTSEKSKAQKSEGRDASGSLKKITSSVSQAEMRDVSNGLRMSENVAEKTQAEGDISGYPKDDNEDVK